MGKCNAPAGPHCWHRTDGLVVIGALLDIHFRTQKNGAGLCLVILGGGGGGGQGVELPPPNGILADPPPRPHQKMLPQNRNEIYQRGPNLEVDFRHTTFCFGLRPPSPVQYRLATQQRPGMGAGYPWCREASTRTVVLTRHSGALCPRASARCGRLSGDHCRTKAEGPGLGCHGRMQKRCMAPCTIWSLIFKIWHRFCRARIRGFRFSWTRNTPRYPQPSASSRDVLERLTTVGGGGYPPPLDPDFIVGK